MKEVNRRLHIKKIVITTLIFVTLWFFLFPLQGLDTLYLYKTLFFGKWVKYKNPTIGLSLQYPPSPFLRGNGFITTSSGWTTIANCEESQFLIVGDQNQVFSVSICTKPFASEIEHILNDKRYQNKDVIINGKNFIKIGTESEIRENLLGRYLISSDRNLLIGIGMPPDSKWFNQAMDKIFLKIISSIKKT